MSDYDPTALLLVCDAILEDGEISGDEVYALATWLNDHKEACSHWPGDSLVPLLQTIWADGKVTKTELRQVGRVLIRIRKESVKRQSQQATEQALTAARQLLQTFDLSQPFLPRLPWTVEIRSHSERGLRYHVDLSLPSCSCPDFHSMRKSFPVAHLNRCCKHIFDAYRQVSSLEDCSGWLHSFIDNGWPPHPRSGWIVLPISGVYVLASSAPIGWANVYSAAGRYGYSVPERRWSYGEEPEHASYIAGIIHRL
jgi:hypothetical protein